MQIDVRAGTVGQFMTQYLDENGLTIPVIGQISISRSVKLSGIPADAWGGVFLFIQIGQDPTVPSGWEDANTSNQNWVVTTSQTPGVVPSLSVQLTWLGVRRA